MTGNTLALVVSSGTIGTGGTLGQAFERSKMSARDAYASQRALNTVFRVRAAQAHHRYEIWTTTAGAMVRLVYWPNEFEFYSVERSSAGILVPGQGAVKTTEETLGIQGVLQENLWNAMSQQGVSADMIWRFSDVFGSRIDFLTEPRKGDTFRMVWKRERYNQAIRDGDILYASYKNGSNPEIFAFLFNGEYYDQNGRSMRGQFLRAPLSYRRISSGFTNRRYHPVLRYNRPHHGIDYAASAGTPVQTIGDGQVISAGWDGGLGRAIRIRHAGSYVSIYGHLSSIASGIHAGKRVSQGQFIGRVGSTGLSTCPHLHFGFEVSGRMVNFLGIKFEQKARTVPDADKDRFRELKKTALTALSRLTPSSQPQPL